MTVKERASSIDFKTRRNDTKILPEKPTAKPELSSILSNTHQYNAGNEKLAESSKF